MTNVSGFDERLAYVRWLRGMGRAEPENTREFAEAIGVEYAWLHKWKASERPPTRRPEIKALIEGLAPMPVTEEWLIDGKGDPPRPDLWSTWSEARRKHQRELRDATKEGARGAAAKRGGATKKKEA